MPKVSAEHREARRQQIVRAAMTAIAREGFAGLTMADVIRESGLSAGAVYTYFASKADLLEAIGQTQLSGVLEIFDRALASDEVPDPADLIGQVSGVLVGLDAEGTDLSVVVIQVMAYAVLGRDDSLPIRHRILELRERWLAVVRRMQAAHLIDPEVAPDSVARVLLSLLPGFVLQRRIVGPITPADYADGLRALMGANQRGGS